LSTKSDLADRVNELLGLNLESLEKMTKEDLEALLKLIEDPSNLIRMGWRKLRDETKRKLVEELVGRPILDDFLKGLQEKGEGGESKDKGPLGFGVVPHIRERVRGILSEKEAK